MPADGRPRCLIYAGHFSELTLRFAREMNRHYAVSVILNRKNYDLECAGMFEFLAEGLDVNFVEGGGLRAILPTVLRKLILVRPDIIQIEETTERWLGLLVRLAKVFGAVVLRVHDVSPHTGSDARLSRRVLEDRTWNRNNVNLAMVHGAHCLRAFSASYRAPAVSTEHGVICVSDEGAKPPGQPGQILMFGRMEEYKGLDVLLAAIGLLEGRGMLPQVKIAGRGPEIDRLSATISSLGGVSVHSDFLSAREVEEAFVHCEIVVVPYKDATQSGVVAAAMAHERVVVASRIGGIPDVVFDGRNGILVEAGNATALADALELTFKNPSLCEQLRKGARVTAQTQLSWRRIADDLLGPWAGARQKRRGVGA